MNRETSVLDDSKIDPDTNMFKYERGGFDQSK